jgi:hypothetical protein
LAKARVDVAVTRVQVAQQKLAEAKERLFLEKKKQRQQQFMTNRKLQQQPQQVCTIKKLCNHEVDTR